MIEFGNALRAAREAKGFSVRQLAEMTRMAPMTVLDLESENFSRIAAPIYGRGFVKLYCSTVGLDPRPFVDEFMELYNGNRETEIRERAVLQAPESPVPQPAEIVAEEPPVQAFEPDLFQQVAASVTESAPTPEPVSEPLPPVQEPDMPATEPSTLSRYAAPVRPVRTLVNPHGYLRVGILAVTALALLGGILFGIRAVYHATTPGTETDAEPAEDALFAKDAPVQPRQTDAPGALCKTTRTPQKIPALYID